MPTLLASYVDILLVLMPFCMIFLDVIYDRLKYDILHSGSVASHLIVSFEEKIVDSMILLVVDDVDDVPRAELELALFGSRIHRADQVQLACRCSPVET